MFVKVLFVACCLLFAFVYAVISYTSGPVPATRNGDLAAGAILYGPLLLAAAVAAVRIRHLKLNRSVAALLVWLTFGTALMIHIGYNLAGGLLGIINFGVIVALAIRFAGWLSLAQP